MMARVDPERRRRSIRLKGYDYTQAGAYFVTVCTHGRTCLFGDVIDGAVRVNETGTMVQTVWDEMSTHYPGVATDAFVIMPNHIYGIIVLTHDDRTHLETGQPRGVTPMMALPDVVHRFKTLTTKRYTDGVKQHGWPPYSRRLWQRNYYEHVIRNEASLNRIRQYIADNPARWTEDPENPVGAGPRACPDGGRQRGSGQPGRSGQPAEYVADNPARWAEDPVGAGPRACPDDPSTEPGQPPDSGQPRGVAPTLGLPSDVMVKEIRHDRSSPDGDRLIPLFTYPPEIRRVIDTTHAIESLQRSLCRVLKTRGAFPNDEPIRKVLYLTLKNVSKKWTMPIAHWNVALNQFAILFADRMPT